MIQVFAEIVSSGAVMLDLPYNVLRLAEHGTGIFDLLFDHFSLHAVSDIQLRPQQHGRSGERQHRNDEHPCQFCR